MDYRVVWVHGIGPTQPGYSKVWDQAYNPYLNFSVTDFIEVYWAGVYSATMSVDNVGTHMITMPPTTQEQLGVNHGIKLVIFVSWSWWFSPLFLPLPFLSEHTRSQCKLLFHKKEVAWVH